LEVELAVNRGHSCGWIAQDRGLRVVKTCDEFTVALCEQNCVLFFLPGSAAMIDDECAKGLADDHSV